MREPDHQDQNVLDRSNVRLAIFLMWSAMTAFLLIEVPRPLVSVIVYAHVIALAVLGIGLPIFRGTTKSLPIGGPLNLAAFVAILTLAAVVVAPLMALVIAADFFLTNE